MKRVLLTAIALLLASCAHQPGDLDGKTVTIQGRWISVAKAGSQIVCETTVDRVDVINVGSLSQPADGASIRVTAQLRWRATPPEEKKRAEREAVALLGDGYYIDWAISKWEEMDAKQRSIKAGIRDKP